MLASYLVLVMHSVYCMLYMSTSRQLRNNEVEIIVLQLLVFLTVIGQTLSHLAVVITLAWIVTEEY